MTYINNYSRIMIAATGSGVGKTTITMGIIGALKKRGMELHAFKSGPDYIDPMYHRSILGVDSKNLDPFFCNEEMLRASFGDSALEGENAINVIEGAMGLFDGIGVTDRASSYATASAIDCPIVLLVDAKGCGFSVIPLIKGFLGEDNKGLIKGVILNRISKAYYEKLAPVIEEKCQVKAVGFLPNNKELTLDSRHLGLLSPEENQIEERLKLINQLIEENIDLDRIREIAEAAKPLKIERQLKDYGPKRKMESAVIAVARDEAFSFYYEDNLLALELCGAQIEYFSPLKNQRLPKNTAGIILGGGYPENYESCLKEAEVTAKEIRKAYQAGIPILAECGGFMYLHYIGLLQGQVFNTNKSVRFGYINIEDDSYSLKGHEFHHYDVSSPGEAFSIEPANGRPQYRAMVRERGLLAGFPHLYYFSDMRLPENFMNQAIAYKKEHIDE